MTDTATEDWIKKRDSERKTGNGILLSSIIVGTIGAIVFWYGKSSTFSGSNNFKCVGKIIIALGIYILALSIYYK